jgi:putative flippase GtrA
MRFLRYAAVGAVATLVHYVLLVVLVEAVGWPAPAAAGAGAAMGAQVAFVGNRSLTFRHGGPWFASWWRFQGTAALGAASGAAIVAAAQSLGLHYLVGQVVATVAGLLITYAVNRYWTFR